MGGRGVEVVQPMGGRGRGGDNSGGRGGGRPWEGEEDMLGTCMYTEVVSCLSGAGGQL